MKDVDDPVLLHLNVIARLLEAAGYALEVDYSAATIIVWAENWPIHLSVKKTQPARVAWDENDQTGSDAV
jgi:hypothetical protein